MLSLKQGNIMGSGIFKCVQMRGVNRAKWAAFKGCYLKAIQAFDLAFTVCSSWITTSTYRASGGKFWSGGCMADVVTITRFHGLGDVSSNDETPIYPIVTLCGICFVKVSTTNVEGDWEPSINVLNLCTWVTCWSFKRLRKDRLSVSDIGTPTITPLHLDSDLVKFQVIYYVVDIFKT